MLFAGPQNVLELNVYDEDSVTEDDACFKVLYDVSEVQPGELLRKTFSLHPQVSGEVPPLCTPPL